MTSQKSFRFPSGKWDDISKILDDISKISLIQFHFRSSLKEKSSTSKYFDEMKL